MLREFTQDVGRYRTGEVKDYPQPTWAKLASSAKLELDDFSKRVTNNPGHQLAVGGPARLRKRLGS